MHFLDSARAVRKGEELGGAKLEAYLRAHLPGAAGPHVVEQFPQGYSNLTYLIRFGPEEFILRRPPFGSKVKKAHDMGREYRVLSKLHPVYGLAPRPLLYCEDESVMGCKFYVMERLKGVILRKDPPPGLVIPVETARRLSEAFVKNLAVLHRVDYQAIGLRDLGNPQGYLERQVQGWIERYCGSQTDEIAEVEPLCAWLAGQIPPESGSTLIHNDYKYDNLVLDPQDITRIIGLLDWEMCTVGDPLADLGSALSYWTDPQDPDELQQIRMTPTTLPGTLSRAQLVEKYAELTGRNVSSFVFYYVLGLFKTAVIVQQIYYRYRAGLTMDERFAGLILAGKALLRAALRSAQSGHL